jgi:hypothetical protein
MFKKFGEAKFLLAKFLSSGSNEWLLALEFWKLMQKHCYSFGKPMQSILFVEEERKGMEVWGVVGRREKRWQEGTHPDSKRQTHQLLYTQSKGHTAFKIIPTPKQSPKFPLSENQC